MSDEKVYLRGHILVPSHRIEQVRAALPSHVDLTRAEQGCLLFEVDEDPVVPGKFNVNEIFDSQESFDTHQVRTRNSAWYEVTEGIPRDYTIKTE